MGLPIVVVLLSHDHYQGGRHHFPIQDASYIYEFEMADTPNVEAGIYNGQCQPFAYEVKIQRSGSRW